jgi:alkanesulfonate monooxygenase SsuD/methylene tetrahydromethanopterin reductase-like flavin-dependent oxidoreductase (luciferase family)
VVGRVRAVADPWVTLAAVASVTERLRLGPMVTPLARRRPAKVARETATLDRLSRGRLTLGVDLGADRFGARALGHGGGDRRPPARRDARRGAREPDQVAEAVSVDRVRGVLRDGPAS